MPKSYEEVANILAELLERSEKTIITVPWQDAYDLSNIRTWHESRTTAIIASARENHRIVVAIGKSGLFVMKDESFSPVVA